MLRLEAAVWNADSKFLKDSWWKKFIFVLENLNFEKLKVEMKVINLCHPIHQECLFLMNSAPINVLDDMKEKSFNRFSATLSTYQRRRSTSGWEHCTWTTPTHDHPPDPGAETHQQCSIYHSYAGENTINNHWASSFILDFAQLCFRQNEDLIGGQQLSDLL